MLKRTSIQCTAVAAFLALAAWAQQPGYPPPPQQGYPPAQQGYPPPPQQGYPPPQQQGYPPQQGYPQQPAYNAPPQGYNQGPGPMMSPGQLDTLVQRIALYPDPLLAQVMTASTYWNEIPDAATWANQHTFLHGDALANAISEDRLPWDASVLALLPFPSVLSTMAGDMGWTQALGNAVLNQRPDVMDAVQRERQRAYSYGYLRPNAQYNVVYQPGDIEIMPTDPGYILVPHYDPYVVFAPPRPGFFVGGAISFGPRIFVGGGFAPFGWGGARFGWRTHDVIVGGHPFVRTYQNRAVYVHPYDRGVPHFEGPRVERHEIRGHEEHRDHR